VVKLSRWDALSFEPSPRTNRKSFYHSSWLPLLLTSTSCFRIQQAPFGLTRGSRQLMERVAVCVSRGEPVLLVGETGVGKTSAIQLLAAKCGVQLRVVNMSMNSEYSDLVGG
jgi:midasin (ATPase involved in ribosome maturation)